MNSRCTISMKNNDGSISSTYCYTQGNLEGAGLMLYEFYRNCQQIENLINMGHIQHLAPLIEPPSDMPHSIAHPIEGVCSFLRRDSAEKITQFQTQYFDSLYEYKKYFMFEENNYFFNYMEELWYAFEPASDRFIELGKALLNNKDLKLSKENIAFIQNQQEHYQEPQDLGHKKDFQVLLDSQIFGLNRKIKR